MGKGIKDFLNPFSKKNPLRPDNLLQDPLGVGYGTSGKTAAERNSSSGSSTAKLSAEAKAQLDAADKAAAEAGWSEYPSDYPENYYTQWKAARDAGQTAAGFRTWIWLSAKNDPMMLDEIRTYTEEKDGTALEKDLLDRTLDDYLYPGLEEDKANQEKFKEMLASYQPAIDANRKLVTDLATEDGTTGHSILATQELANLDEAIETSKGAIDTRQTSKLGNIDTSLAEVLAAIDQQQKSKQGNLDDALAEYLSAIDSRETDKLGDLDPLLQARLDSAEGLATSASLGEQAARDQIVADLAAQGYFGGSSFSDGQLAQASIAARQAAANALGSAREANAKDVLNVNNEATDSTYDANTGITTKRLGVDDDAADAIFANTSDASKAKLGVNNEAADSLFDTTSFGADQRLAYLDADTKRRLSNLETPLTLAQDEMDMKLALDDAGWAGLKRGLNTLNWWKLSQADGGGNVVAAPNTVDTTPSAAGAIGPSLVNAGLSIAQSKNWWQKQPTKTS